MGTGNFGYTQMILRDTIKAFPQDEVCRRSLANLLANTKQKDAQKKIFKTTVSQKKQCNPSTPDEMDIYAQLNEYKTISKADFFLRRGDAMQKKKAKKALNDIINNDHNNVYANLVASIHDSKYLDENIIPQIAAFPNVFPLRYMVAKQSNEENQWKKLIADFPNNKYYTYLGKLVCSSNNGATLDTSELLNLYNFCEKSNPNDKFDAFFNQNLKNYVFYNIVDDENIDQEIIKKNTVNNRETLNDLIYKTLIREVRV